MSFNPDQFREVIRCTLQDFDEKVCSDSAIELLMLTAAQESNLGEYFYQINGPAVGVFQVEPKTYLDILNRVILPKYISFPVKKAYELITDIKTSVIVARMLYWSFPQPLPKADDIQALGRYYKQYFNTHAGKATVEGAVSKYRRYCL